MYRPNPSVHRSDAPSIAATTETQCRRTAYTIMMKIVGDSRIP